MTNGERLAAWRKSKNLSQETAAGRIGVAQGTWAPWESGKKLPGLANALAIEKLTRGAVRASRWEPRPKPAAPESGTDVEAKAIAS